MLLFLILKFLGLIGIILNASNKHFYVSSFAIPKQFFRRESEEKIIKWVSLQINGLQQQHAVRECHNSDPRSGKDGCPKSSSQHKARYEATANALNECYTNPQHTYKKAGCGLQWQVAHLLLPASAFNLLAP